MKGIRSCLHVGISLPRVAFLPILVLFVVSPVVSCNECGGGNPLPSSVNFNGNHFAGVGTTSSKNVRESADSGRLVLSDRVKNRLVAAIDKYNEDILRRRIFMVKTGQVELGPNMARNLNPDFEEIWGEGKHSDIPKGEEWRAGVAHGWGISPETLGAGGVIDTIKRAEKDAEYGWRSGRIKDVREKAYYLVGIPGIAVGEYYLARTYAKLRTREARGDANPRVRMLVRWTGAEGWIRNPSYMVELKEVNIWRPLEIVVIPPDGARTAQVFLFAENVTDGMEVLFDNLSFQLIEGKVD